MQAQYDSEGNPIDPYQQGIPYTSARAPSVYQQGFQQPAASVPSWQVATGAGAAPAGSFLPDWRFGQPDQAGATNAAGDPYSAPPAAAAPPPPQADQGGGGGGGGGSLIDPFNQQFQPPANYYDNANSYLPPPPHYEAPAFHAPTYTPPPAWSYASFSPLDKSSVLNEPGYQFGMDQGEQALANAKAAQGIYGTGATLKAILGWGGDYATGRYGDAEARQERVYGMNRQNSLDAYNTNYQTQYTDPYKFAYQGALDAFSPQMAAFNANVGAGNLDYSTRAAAGQHQNDMNYQNAWNSMLFNYDRFRDQRDSTFNHQLAVTGL